MVDSVDFLFELGTEELPPTTLTHLSDALVANVVSGLKDANVSFKTIEPHATPRRLAFVISQLQAKQADTTEVKLGPAVAVAFDDKGEPTNAAQGFARSCGLSVAELDQIDTDKGQRLGTTLTKPGKATSLLLVDIITSALASLPIAKSMRWGNRQSAFVRPVKWLVALYGNEVLEMSLYGCQADRVSFGHRFMSNGPLTINDPTSYPSQLAGCYVISSRKQRQQMIKEQVATLAQQANLHAVIEEALLDEVSALVEWPVALMGSFESEFLAVPKEALISTMSKNQKYFHLLDHNGDLANKFITIANIESSNPASVISGNERVIRPRFADAKFFYNKDCERSLSTHAIELKNIIFQNQLGSIADKCSRIALVAAAIADRYQLDASLVSQAASICKADLVTEMVGEFPSLQGIMGKYYAREEGLDSEVCEALEEIYLPRSATDVLPKNATGTCLALADRIDTLVGIFGIKQVPTGNKDPYALRRASLGILRIIRAQNLPLDIAELIDLSLDSYANTALDPATKNLLLAFFNSRTKAMYLDEGYSSPLITAVESLNITKPVDFYLRLEAVKAFERMTESDSLAAANKRVANILSKNSATNTNHIEERLLDEPSERRLYRVYEDISKDVLALCRDCQYVAALEKLVLFKDPLDSFFDQVMVMVDDDDVRNNRIKLLEMVRSLFLSVADISSLQK